MELHAFPVACAKTNNLASFSCHLPKLGSQQKRNTLSAHADPVPDVLFGCLCRGLSYLMGGDVYRLTQVGRFRALRWPVFFLSTRFMMRVTQPAETVSHVCGNRKKCAYLCAKSASTPAHAP